jgi:cell shape-determining protein MreD
MRRLLIILAGILIGLMQISLRGLGSEIVVPNLALVAVVFLSAKLDFSYLGTIAISLGVILELSSAAPVGTQILGLLLVVLVSKLLLRSSGEESQFWYLYALLLSCTLGYSLALGLTVPFAELQVHWGVLLGRIALECLYNSVLFGFCTAVAARQIDTKKKYRLPR